MMINEALEFIASELNVYFRKIFQVSEDKVIVSNLVNAEGNTPIAINDKLVICLANIEQETSVANLGFVRKTNDGFQVRNQPLNISLYVLFAAHFNNYNESLKFISATISFFQFNYVFLSKDYPALEDLADKLVFELLKTDYQNAHYLWNALGARYMPSMIYKLRMLTIDEQNILKSGSLISSTDGSVGLK